MTKHDDDIAHLPRYDQGSFRDPSGFVFTKNDTLYRQINPVYARSYDMLMASGLYDDLVRKGYLISHEEVSAAGHESNAYKIIQPERVPFISYPYEWCFSELKDAALLTLKVQRIALKFGMTLKDASAYNVQFKDGHPVLIDTLSFEPYEKGMPWVAYRQFCKHFLAPLALMSLADVRLGSLLQTHIDGIPLDLASRLLPWKSWFSVGLFFHVHLHAKSERRYARRTVKIEHKLPPISSLSGLIESLKSAVAQLSWKTRDANEAYEGRIISSIEEKERVKIIQRYITQAKPKTVWDISSSDGVWSYVVRQNGSEILALSADPAVVERNYLACKRKEEKHTLQLVLDLTNPSPALGWANTERASLVERGPADLIVAFGLIHYLAIANNVPFLMLAEFFAKIGQSLMIEFIPKEDVEVEHLLRNRADVFGDYTQERFERAFGRYFTVDDRYSISDTKRVVYLMKGH